MVRVYGFSSTLDSRNGTVVLRARSLVAQGAAAEASFLSTLASAIYIPGDRARSRRDALLAICRERGAARRNSSLSKELQPFSQIFESFSTGAVTVPDTRKYSLNQRIDFGFVCVLGPQLDALGLLPHLLHCRTRDWQPPRLPRPG